MSPGLVDFGRLLVEESRPLSPFTPGLPETTFYKKGCVKVKILLVHHTQSLSLRELPKRTTNGIFNYRRVCTVTPPTILSITSTFILSPSSQSP